VFSVSRKHRLPLTVALLVGLFVIGAILSRSHGAKPISGGTYTGTVYVPGTPGHNSRTLSIGFTVDRAADQVEAFRFPKGLPRHCSSATTASVGSGSAKIVSPDKFLARLPILRSGTRIGTLLISGSFGSLNRESGAVQTTFSAAGLKRCGAVGGYMTKAPLGL
jgi:hypothetical protein